jgi:hypothetical protein
MPTEDYSNSSRTAKLRQKASLKGLNKVARALDYDTQLSIHLGGVVQKTKNSSGVSYDCACPPNTNTGCVGTFSVQEDVIATLGAQYTCDGNQCVRDGDLDPPTYPQINAIPGTSVTISDTVAIVNCTSSPVTVDFLTYRMPDGPDEFCMNSGLVGVLQPGNCFIYEGLGSCRINPGEYFETVYTFSERSVR